MTTAVPLEVAGPTYVERFDRTERAVHWVQAISFLVLLLTGFGLQLPIIEGTFGHRALLHQIHLAGAFFLVFGPAIVALAGNRRAIGRDIAAVDTWDRDDLRWLIPASIRDVLGMETPRQGRFNAGQKLNAIFVVWSTLTFGVTGLILWQNRRFPSDIVSQANSIHSALAYLALFAFLGHVYLAALYPPTRHALRAITSGWVRVDWAEIHHRKWLTERAAQIAPEPRTRFDSLRLILQIIFGSFVTLFAVRVYFFHLGANVTDPITRGLYALTAWPGAAGIHPATGVSVTDWIGAGYGALCLAAWLLADRLRRGSVGPR